LGFKRVSALLIRTKNDGNMYDLELAAAVCLSLLLVLTSIAALTQIPF